MNYDYLWGVFAGFGGGMVVGAVVGVRFFRKGIEDGLRMHDVLDEWIKRGGK